MMFKTFNMFANILVDNLQGFFFQPVDNYIHVDLYGRFMRLIEYVSQPNLALFTCVAFVNFLNIFFGLRGGGWRVNLKST